MNKSITFLFIPLLLCCFSVFSQPRLTGKILDENNLGLAGATVLERRTSNGTVSDLEGNFALQLLDSGTVNITFIGYFEQQIRVNSDSSVEIRMNLDTLSEALSGVISCFLFQPRISKTGLNYGAINNTFGIESQNFIYSIWRLNLKLTSDIKWRFIGDDPYFNLRLRRFDIYSKNSFSVGLRGEYKSIEESGNKMKFYSISPDFSINGYIFSIGYANRNNTLTESMNSENGINLEFQKYLFNHVAFRVGSIYWGDDWQYNINLTGQIPKSRFLIGAGWEQIGEWNEIDFSLLYKLSF